MCGVDLDVFEPAKSSVYPSSSSPSLGTQLLLWVRSIIVHRREIHSSLRSIQVRVSRCRLLDHSLDVLNNSVGRRGRPAAPLITQVCSSALQTRIGPGSLSYVESISRSMTTPLILSRLRKGVMVDGSCWIASMKDSVGGKHVTW